MKPLYKGLAVAIVHLLLVLSLGGKYLYDRATCPRVWTRSLSYDPDLPIRGRYFTLNLEVHPDDPANMYDFHSATKYGYGHIDVALSAENGQLVARKAKGSTGMHVQTWGQRDRYFLSPPALFFLSEHADTPRIAGTELWVEVTVPKNGPPRPIQLALKRGKEWTPLTYR